ncbi:MAG TPA: ABC transporter permease [Chthonomonadaceae bacterium]|nr:ABC transporter permease [Chthonomonadaceae bacterium]
MTDNSRPIDLQFCPLDERLAIDPLRSLESEMGQRADSPAGAKDEKPGRGGGKPVTLYTPHGHLGIGLAAWREMILELVASRELTWRFLMRDISARYRQSVFGYLWAILPALLTTVTFTWLNRANVLPVKGTTLPYPVFVLLGMSVWQLFATGLTNATQSLVNAGTLISKIGFPRETLVIAAFGQSVFDSLIRIALLAAAFALYRVVPSPAVVLIPVMLVPLCLLTLGLGLLFALLNGVLRDMGQMVTFGLMFGMFLTPIVYPAEGVKSWLMGLNPVSPFVIAAQDLTTKGHLSQPAAYAGATLFSAAVFLVAWRIFHLTEPRIAERV